MIDDIVMFIILFITIRIVLELPLQYEPFKSKIAGNITSIINGVLLILSPFIIWMVDDKKLALLTIIQLNIAYNIVDFVNASIIYKIHHSIVFVCDYLIIRQESLSIQLCCMTIYSLIELSNVFVWKYYHAIHYNGFKPTIQDIKIQLLWFGVFRIIAAIIGFVLCVMFELWIELSVLMLINIGSVFWGYGMYKKIK